MPLSCKDIVNQSTDFIDENSSWSNRLSVQFHLLMCHHCRRFIRHKKIAGEYIFRQQKMTQFSDEELDDKVDDIMHQLKQAQTDSDQG